MLVRDQCGEKRVGYEPRHPREVRAKRQLTFQTNPMLVFYIYSWLPITRIFKENQKRFVLSGVLVIGGWDSCWHHLSQVFSPEQLTRFAYQNTKKMRKLTQTIIDASKLLQNKFGVMEYVLSHYTITNEVRVIEGKIIKKMTWRE